MPWLMKVLLGYFTISKAYKIFNRRSLVIEESIHVVFDESIMQNSKNLEVEDEELNKYTETEKLDTQIRIDNEEENNQEEDPIETIGPSLPKDWKYASSHPQEQIIGDPSQRVKTRSKFRNLNSYLAFVSQIKSKSIEEAECDSDWMVAMQEELN